MYEEESSKNYNDISQSGRSRQNKENGGLIPVSATILKQASVIKGQSVEYRGCPLCDITAIGYVVDYKEIENKVKLTIFDYTGLMDINFFKDVYGNDTLGLDKFHYDGSKTPVQIFGTVKIFKNEINVQGAKLIIVPPSYVLYHRADVIHAWLYLLGQLDDLKQNQVQTSAEEAKMIALKNDNSGSNNYNERKNTPEKNQKDKDFKEAVNLLENYMKKNNKNEIETGDMNNLLKKFGNRINNIINLLINDNKLIETDNGYEIMI